MKSTYLLLHPCAGIIVDKIFDMLKKNEFMITAVYRISCWDEILSNLYKNTYKKGSGIEEHVQSHAYINRYLFGNCGLILLLQKNISYDTLVQETLHVKRKLREAVNKTKDGTITIFLDVNRSIYNEIQAPDSFIPYSDRSLKIFLSYVHCPDTIEQYEEDFDFLQGYLKDALSPQEIERVIKYRSFYYQIENYNESDFC